MPTPTPTPLPRVARRVRSMAALLPLACAALLGACGNPQLTAHWRDRELAVDGKLDDWAGLQSDLAIGKGTSPARLGIANDGEALYLSVATADANLARLISRRGLTVWFDRAGGKAHTLGVRFPLPAARPPSRWGEIGGSRPGGAQLDNLELLGPQPFTRRQVSAPGADGVQVAIGFAPPGITYELRVPLAAAQAWGLGVAPGARLGVGLQSRGIEARPHRGGGRPGDGGGDGGSGPDGSEPAPPGDRPPGDEPPGGEDPADGGARGGPGGRGPRPGAVRDFEAWAVVHLASPPG